MAGHTPGPWMVRPCCDSDETRDIVADYKELPNGNCQAHWIAELDAHLDFDSDTEAQYAEMEANAHLIAAAPDLLAALKAMLGVEESVTQGQERERRAEAVPMARAAIAKAEGR